VFHTAADVQLGDNIAGLNFGNDTLCEQTTTYTTCLHGTDDNFVGPEPSNISPGLLTFMQAQYDYITDFDQPADNQAFGHTFEDCWNDGCLVIGATLRIKLRGSAGGTGTDWMAIGDYSQGNNGRIWSITLSDLDAHFGGDGVWDLGEVAVFTLDLADLPFRHWLPTNILAALQNGDLDIVVSDDTEVDFIEISVELCCPCTADGDANGDAVPLTAADLAYLDDFINGCGLAPIPLYSCDLNGDGVVDPADLQLYNDYFVSGIGVFLPYGGYPVPCPCNPIAKPVPDTVNIFGLEHVSVGPTCLEEVGGELVVSRFIVNLIPEGILIDIPDAISSPSSKVTQWQGEFKEDPSLEIGATIQVDCAGIVYGVPDTYIGSSKQTKQASGIWDLFVNEGASSYTVEAYLAGEVIWSQTSIPASGEWLNTGSFGSATKAPDTGPHFQSASNMDDAGIVAIEWQDADTVDWNWPEQSVSGLAVDCLRIIPEGLDSSITGLSSIGIDAQQLDSFTIISESYGFNYRDIIVTNLGNAILTPVDTTLEVSNIGSSGADGMSCEPEDGDYPDDLIYAVEIIMENPDLSGTWPVGASLGVEYVFAAEPVGETFPMESFFDFAGSNTWNLGVASNHPLYTVEAYNNETSVFSVEGVAAADLGYIVESAKGVHPVGFKGGSTGKPAGIVASADYDFTAHPDGVQWSWAAQGVSGQTIDYLSVTSDTTVAGNNPVDLCSAAIRASNGGVKDAPISFTILDIQVETGCCVIRGDIDRSGIPPVDIADLVYLVDFMFNAGPVPFCFDEGDVDASGVEPIDIADLVYLVDYMFNSGPIPPVCP